jgi:hypothetical protein
MSAGAAARRGIMAVVAVALLSLAGVVGTVAPAGATGGDHQPSGPGAGCLAPIDRRVKDVDKLVTKVESAYDVTPAHRSTLIGALRDARAGLVALRAEVVTLSTPILTPQHEEAHEGQAIDTSISPALAAACERVYADFRIYALRKPQVHLVLAADRVIGQRPLYSLLGSELQAAIAASPTDPDVPEALRLLDDYRAKIASADVRTTGLADAVVGFGPGDWNDEPALLRPYLDTMRQVKLDLRSAKKDARQIVALLGEGSADGTKTTGRA